jgi:hypothetical protein
MVFGKHSSSDPPEPKSDFKPLKTNFEYDVDDTVNDFLSFLVPKRGCIESIFLEAPGDNMAGKSFFKHLNLFLRLILS